MKQYAIKEGQEQFIIPIGARVRIKDDPSLGMLRSYHANQEATVIGYADSKVTVITMLCLERDGDIMFKWPRLFPWQIECISHQKVN